jgi:hypothetical protein
VSGVDVLFFGVANESFFHLCCAKMTTEVKMVIIPDEQPVVTSVTSPPSPPKETKSSAMLEINLEETRMQSPAGDASTERFLADTLTTDDQLLVLNNNCKSVLEVLKQGKAFFGPCPGTNNGEMDKKTIVTEVDVYGPVKADITEFLLRQKGSPPFVIPGDPVFSRVIRDAGKRKCVMVSSAVIVGYSTEGLRWPVRMGLTNALPGDQWWGIESFPFQDVCNWDSKDSQRPVGTCLIPPGTKSIPGHSPPLRLVGDDPLLRAWHKRLIGVPICQDFLFLPEKNKEEVHSTVLVDMTEYLEHPASPTSPLRSWLVARFWPFLREATLRLHHPTVTVDLLIITQENLSNPKRPLTYVNVDTKALNELYGLMLRLSGQIKLVDLSGDSTGILLDMSLCGHGTRNQQLLEQLKTLRKEQAWGNRDDMVLSAWDKMCFRIRFELRTFVNPDKVSDAMNREKILLHCLRSVKPVDHDGTYRFTHEKVFGDMVKRPVIYQPPKSA